MNSRRKSHNFVQFDPIFIIGFLTNFKLTCKTSGIHKGAEICLLNFFHEETRIRRAQREIVT